MLTRGQSFRQWSRRSGFNPRSRHTKDLKKWYLIPTCLTLSIIRIKGKVEQSSERISDLPYTLVQQLSKKEPLGHPRVRLPKTTFKLHTYPKLNRTIFIRMDLALNSLQRLICHKTQTTNQSVYSDLSQSLPITNTQPKRNLSSYPLNDVFQIRHLSSSFLV